MLKIEHIDDHKKGVFKILEDGIVAGRLYYTWAGESKFTIDHTEVDPAFGGKGFGKKLVLEAVKMARERKAKVVPLCPLAKSLFDKLEEIQDVLF